MRDILHISDVHFGPPHRPHAAAAVLALVEERRPDLVVLSGDLTQRAKPRQFVEARQFVDRIAAPVLCVPGNHDVPLYRAWERFFAPYGAYRKHFASELEPVFEDDELLVVGVNTAHGWTFTGGRFRSRRLREVERLLGDGAQGRCAIVVAHHDLIPPPRFESQRVSRNAREAVELFSRRGVELVLSGHEHQAYGGTTEDFYPSGRSPVRILHSGTTTSSRGRGSEIGRNSCNWLRVRELEIVVSRLWLEGDRFEERSRHLYPRRAAIPYKLATGEHTAQTAPPGERS